MDRWIKIHSSITDWEWFDKPEMVSLLLYLIVTANYTERTWQGLVIERGQLVTTIPNLSKAVGISIKQTRTCLTRLKMGSTIDIKGAAKHTIITICNYDSYQASKECEGQQMGSIKGIERAVTLESIEEKERITKVIQKKEASDSTECNVSEDRFDYVSEEMIGPFREWLEYKKERKQSYKSKATEQRCYNHLMKIAKNSPELARETIYNSIANNYQGLFLPKQQNYGQAPANDRRASKQQYDKEFEQHICSVLTGQGG